MSRKTIWLGTIICLVLAACRKENKVYSTWNADGKEYSSNDVTASVGKAISILGSNDASNRFSLTFYIPYLPTVEPKTEWPMVNYNPDQNPNVANLYFYVDGVYYYLSYYNTTQLISSSNKGKAAYHLSSAWFINSNNSDDSILISGIFNEP